MQDIEEHVGSDAAVVGGHPIVELILGPNDPELGKLEKDVDEPGKGPEEFDDGGDVHKRTPEHEGEQEDGGDLADHAWRDVFMGVLGA